MPRLRARRSQPGIPVILLAACAFGALAARGAMPAGSTDAAIDAECANLADRALAGEPRRVARIYGERADGSWTQADATALARIARDPDIYSELADAWSVDGHVSVVSITARSLEFRANTAYCFRLDGTLARVLETSNGGNTLDDEARYLAPDGRIVARRSRFAPLYPQPGATLSPDLRPGTPALYRTVRALPFYALVAPAPQPT